MKKNEIYSEYFVREIKRKAIIDVVKYVAVTFLFVALCVAFCLLAAFDFVNVYACCVINVLFSVAFMWYSYLFFFVLYKPSKAKVTFVKCLENAFPSIYQGTYVSCEEGEQYLNLHFEDGNVLKLDSNAVNGFVVGKRYLTDVVGDVIISYGEAEYE